MTVVSLNAPKRQVNPNVVDGLEALLEMAKAGELDGFAAALIYYDGTAGTYARGTLSTYAMIGAAATLPMLINELREDL